RDFLTLLDCSPEELKTITRRGTELRNLTSQPQSLAGKSAVMMFQLNSTRTRVAFEVGLKTLGGHAVILSPADSQFGRGEPVEDMARVLSEMVDAVIIRTTSQALLEDFAAAATIPVINAMSERYHPCQLLADVQTFEELRGPIEGRTVSFVGDGYNMCNSYINAARQWGFHLKIAAPEGYEPDPELLKTTNNAELVATAEEAVAGADLVVTDVWSSMGHEGEEHKRLEAFAPYQVNEQLLDGAASDVLFMHCLPAHRGEEISETLLDDPRSCAFHEAGNRLHSQKALLEFLLT
ncbi:MAG: ornithine carbamoyltransferase, partial [Pseudomonadota bacterium]